MSTLSGQRRGDVMEKKVKKADLDWPNLAFGYLKTDCNIRYTWKDGQWGEGVLHEEETMPLHIAATCLHYGQECFEGLKAFETRQGDVVVFRIDENARRLGASCRKVHMEPPPEALFIEAVTRCINANRRFVPPYGTGASLYIRPLVLGTGPQVGVKPAGEYMFMVFVTPVGPYFKTGFKPVNLIVEEEVDRAAPLGVGDVKVGGNYAAGLRASDQSSRRADTPRYCILTPRRSATSTNPARRTSSPSRRTTSTLRRRAPRSSRRSPTSR
jgi:branched-chain amino acid aminotransferase